ncbi:MAG: hypothetical protein HY332_18705 [Chloroflexi bacterium]|nr:hypothetical protein [Chloroflexota bacterium]
MTVARDVLSTSGVVAPADGEIRVTRFSDVCGGTDELKRLLVEEPVVAASPEGRLSIRMLVEDGQYMLARMERRLREYETFRDDLAAVVETMQRLAMPRLDDAAEQAARLRELLTREGTLPVQEIIDRAEAIRQVANDTEGTLRRYKEASIMASRAYLRLKGARGWGDDGGSTSPSATHRNESEDLPPGVPEAWLPPPPHREKIVDWLCRGRATLFAEEEAAQYPVGPQGPEPIVQFEDGGVMPLRAVRWSDEVRNFYPLGSAPHPRGSLYRKRDAAPAPPPV